MRRKMKNIFKRVLAATCAAAMVLTGVLSDIGTLNVQAAGEHTLWVVGDSTVSSHNDTSYYYPRYGYGTQLENYLDDTYTVQNLALSGRSSKSFLSESNYATLTAGIKEGDILVVGFGHNDQKTDEARYTSPEGDYTTEGSFAKSLYDNYVKVAQDAGAEVILCTPIVRRSTDGNWSGSSVHIANGGDYSQVVRDLGAAVNVPVVDMTALTKAMYTELGTDETAYLHAWSSYTGCDDNTHLNIYGAKRVAYLFASAVKETSSALAACVDLSAGEPTKANDLVRNPNYVMPKVDLKEGTIAFAKAPAGYLCPGIALNNIDGQSNDHGIVTFADGATMTLYLSKKANIVVEECCYLAGTSGTMTASSGEVTSVEYAENDTMNGLKFTVTGAEAGELTLTFARNMFIHSVTVEYVEESAGDSTDSNALAEGKIDFAKAPAGYTYPGITLTSIDGQNNDHGIVSLADGATMVLNLAKPANITVEECGYLAGTNGTMTASSGVVNSVERAEGSVTGLTFTVTGMKSGEQTLTFARNMYIHSITIEYIEGAVEEEPEEVLDGIAEGTLAFAKAPAGVTYENITLKDIDGNNNGHGIVTFADGATMTLKLAKRANIIVEECGYLAGTSGTMTASSGKVTSVERAEGDVTGLTFTITKADAGELVLTFARNMYIHSITVEYLEDIVIGDRLIDVWDFGGVHEEDTSLYANKIALDFWETYKASGTDGKFVDSGTPMWGDLTLSHLAKDRHYGVGAMSAGEKKTAFEDGYNSLGYYYANGTGGEGRRNVVIRNVKAGDKIVAYMGSHNSGAAGTLYFDLLDDSGKSSGKQIDASEYTVPQKHEFVAQYSGTYKLWADASSSTSKPAFHRVMRVPYVVVTGTVNMGDCTDTDYTVRFINDTTGVDTVAELDGNNFTAVLAPGYSYTAAMSGAQGWGFTNTSKRITLADTDFLEGVSGVQLDVEPKVVYNYTGSIKGFDAAYDISKLAITLTPPADTVFDAVPLKIAEDLSFTAQCEPDVEYTLVMEGVNDYEITSTLSFSGTEPRNEDITVALKAKYDVTGGFLGLGEGAKVTDITFTNVEDGYTYTGTVNEDGYAASLRDGAYAVIATVEGYKTSTHVVVEGAKTVKDLLFVSTTAAPAVEWVSDIYVGYPDKANNYDTMTEAMAAAKAMKPASEEQRITVHIAPGTYREQIFVEAPYLTFVNEEPAKGEVLLTWYYGIGYSYYSADKTGYYNPENAYDKYEKNTVSKWGCSVYIKNTATDFRAENITFEASLNRYITDEEIEDGVECVGKDYVRKYGVDVRSKDATERASAIAVEGDRAEFYNCKFYSSQDTLYTGGPQLHSYFKNCFIEGNTDYIFGDGNVVFDNCELSFAGYSVKAAGGYITAARDEAPLGYLFRNCTVTTSKDSGQLHTAGLFGRNWGLKAQVTFVDTKLETADMIGAAGWTAMAGAVTEARYKEFNTTALDGKTVDTSGRVANTVLSENPKIDVTTYFGEWVPAYYVAEAATIEFKIAPYVTDNGDLNVPMPGHTFTVHYSLGEANDANDASIIEWYRVKDGTATLVKTAAAGVDKTYKLVAEDAGCNIKVVVTPVTVSGTTGTAKEMLVEGVVLEGYEDPSAGADAVLGDGVNVFLAGDSTVKHYGASGMYMNGKQQDHGSWGEWLQAFFNEEKVTVVNYANGGRSTRNFLNEGSLDKIAANIGEGDYLFIQFAHNDCADSEGYRVDRYAPVGIPDENGIYPTTPGVKGDDGKYAWDCGGTYKWYLQQYINVAKEAGATPVVVSAVARMYYNSEGAIRTHHDDSTSQGKNAYCIAAKQAAEENGALFIDGYALTEKMYVDAYKADPNAANGKSVYGTQTMSPGDATHCNKLGGFITAALFAQTIQNMDLDISLAVKMPAKIMGETLAGQTVFTVNGSNEFTAYGIETDFVEKAEYWMGMGQAVINEIGAKADELLGSDSEGDKPAVDTTALAASIAVAEGLTKADYTAESWAAVETALAAAKAELANTAATAESVTAAKKALDDAVSALVKEVPKTEEEKKEEATEEIKEEMREAESLKESEYTAESWATFQNALAAAYEILNNNAATSEQIAAAKATLANAMAALTKAGDTGNSGSNDSDDSDDDDESAENSGAAASPKTGDKTPFGAMIAMLGVALVAAVALFFKKKEAK